MLEQPGDCDREIPGHLDVRELQSSTPVTGACLPAIALCHLIAHCDLENSSVIMGMQGEDIHTKTQAFFSLCLYRRSPAASQPPVSRVNLQGKPCHGLSPCSKIINMPFIQKFLKTIAFVCIPWPSKVCLWVTFFKGILEFYFIPCETK